MGSKLAIVVPLISTIYLFQTLFKKRLKVYLKLPLTLLSFSILIFDVFVFLVFFVNCIDFGNDRSVHNCIDWIYPTLDFKMMIAISLTFLIFAFIGLLRHWNKNFYYLIGSIVLYLGVLFRVLLLAGAAEAISISSGSSNPIVFEIFSIVIVYGLVSAAIYFSIFFLGMFTAKLP